MDLSTLRGDAHDAQCHALIERGQIHQIHFAVIFHPRRGATPATARPFLANFDHHDQTTRLDTINAEHLYVGQAHQQFAHARSH
ncbi:MAG: hypothetical protein GY929_12965 [Actinomycetia bacterium]|nr:hypothetical protein [Actinomycetes bacterium]